MKLLKKCTKCEQLKPVAEFNKDVTRRDGCYPSCKECYSEYYAKIREQKLIYKREYREKNKVKISEFRRKHYQQNKETGIQAATDWATANPDKRRVASSNRRARKRAAQGKYEFADVVSLLKSQHGKCAYCRLSINKEYHIDHIMPLSRNGGNDKYNIQLLCPTCNLQKRDKHPIDFMQQRGFLL